MTNRTVKVTIQASVTGAIANVKAFKSTLTDFGSEVDRAALKHKEAFGKIFKTTALVGAGLVGAFGLAVKSAMDFDKEMSAVGSVAGTNAKGLDQLRQAAITAGQATAYSATDAARAEEELAKAGISVKDVLGGGLKGALSLAAAGQMDLADAATISAQAMNVFHLSGAAVPHIADVLAASANKSAADMHDLGDAIKQGGLVASQFGLSLEDTTGVLSAFADRALIGSDAGTSLKTMLQALANPSAKSASLMQELGISAYDTSGKFVGIAKFAGILQTQLQSLTQQQRDQALAQIFGSDAMRAANVLYTQGSTGIGNYIDSVNDQGAAARTAAEKMNNLSGDVEQLKGSLETLAIQSGSGANNGLRLLAQGATGAVNAFAGLPAPLQQGVTLLAGISGAGILAGTGLAKARQSGSEIMDTLRAMGPAGTTAATGLGKVATIAGKAGIAIAGIGLAFVAADIISHLTGFASKSKVVAIDVDAMTNSLEKFAKTGKTSGELQKAFGTDLVGLHAQMQQITELSKRAAEMQRATSGVAGAILAGGGAGAGAAAAAYNSQLAKLNEKITATDGALANLVNNGNATAAQQLLGKLATAAGMSVDDFTAKLPQYQAAIDGAAYANTGLAQGFGDVAQNSATMATGLQDAIDHGQSLADVFDQLNGAAEDFARGEIGFQQSIDDLSDALKKNGNTLDVNSQKGRDNKSAILDSIDAAAKAAQAKYTETGSVQAASDTYNTYIRQLKNTLTAAHWTDKEIDALIKNYATMPPVVSTTVKAPGLTAANSTARGYSRVMGDMDGKTVSSTIVITTVHNDRAGFSREKDRWGGIHTHAADGLLSSARTYSSVNPGRYMIAEPSTGGEAFVPRLGDYGRSTSILDQASRWYGGRFVPNGAMGGGGAPAHITITLVGGDASTRAIMANIRSEVNHAWGGRVDIAMGRA